MKVYKKVIKSQVFPIGIAIEVGCMKDHAENYSMDLSSSLGRLLINNIGNYYTLLLPLEKDDSTIAHEATNIVDEIFEYIGVSSRVDTEIRAYLVGWVVKEIGKIYSKVNR